MKAAQDLFDVQDRIVVITGGAGQLGRQFSLALSSRGARVAIFDLQCGVESACRSFDQEISEGRVALFEVDVTDRSSIEAGLESVIRLWGIPHALVNNAGLDSPPNAPGDENGPFETYPEESWDKVMEVNSKGVFLCCQAIGGRMAEKRRGSIINISSIYGLVSPDQGLYEYRRKGGDTFFKPAAYSASKSSLLNLTRYLATYWAPKNVRVNALTLGGVFNDQDSQFLEGYRKRTPLGRMAEAHEYNGAIIFLISDASGYMTGSNMIVDGGWTAW